MSFLITFNLSFASSENYQKELDAIFKAFQEKDYELLKPLLDDKVRIGDLPQGFNDMVLPQVLNQLPKPVSYKITDEAKEENGYRVHTEYTYESGLVRPQSFLFDSNKKIIDFDVLAGAKTMTAQAPQVQGDQARDYFEVPFKVKKGIILVKAKVDGKSKTFIFDSGAPTLILNSDALDASKVTNTGAAAMGVGGMASLGAAPIQSFQWSNVQLNDFDAITMSMKHLEKAVKHKVAGIIGYTLFSEYRITYNYAKKVLIFEKTDENGEVKNDKWANVKPEAVMPFRQIQHIPIFEIDINDATYQVGLDCGAAGNLLAAKHFDAVSANGNIKKTKEGPMHGAGKEKVQIKAAKVKHTNIDGILYPNMTYAFEDATLDQLNTGYQMNLDGLLGYPFLKQYITVVNYKKKEIRTYK